MDEDQEAAKAQSGEQCQAQALGTNLPVRPGNEPQRRQGQKAKGISERLRLETGHHPFARHQRLIENVYEDDQERRNLIRFRKEFRKLVESLSVINKAHRTKKETDWLTRMAPELRTEIEKRC